MLDRAEIINFVRSWVGVRWRHQGRNRFGIDCAGLVVVTARHFEQSHFDNTEYTRTAQRQRLLNYFRTEMIEIPVLNVREGDVLMFRDGAFPCHVGFYSEIDGVPHLLHAHAARRCVLEERYTEEWKERVVAAFKFKGVKDADGVPLR